MNLVRAIAVAAAVVVWPGNGESAQSSATSLPYAVQVDDGTGGTLMLRIRPVVEGGKFSSGFGWRGHAMGGGSVGRHTGIDIVAPKGTPIRAAASGVIADLGSRGGYGRMIVVRHADGLETAYAHLSRFEPGLKTGRRVQPGEIIGYVGSTGRANGAHLHYELRKGGKPVDPLSFPPAER